jgi:magnesium transporter
VCLDHVSTTMSDKVRLLEIESAAALEKLAQRVTAHHLEHVRRVKNNMVRLNTRVETVRVLLEKYLGDDEDLAELHLTGRRYTSSPVTTVVGTFPSLNKC